MPKLLLIDDHGEQWALTLERPFAAASWQIDVAVTVEDGLTRLRRRDIDLVLLDLQFAQSSLQGSDALRSIRSQYPDTPVIILTNSDKAADIRTAVACVKQGAWDYYTKAKLDARKLVAECQRAVDAVMTEARRKRLVDSFRRTANDMPYFLVTSDGDHTTVVFAMRITSLTKYERETQELLSPDGWVAEQRLWHQKLVAGLLSRLPGRSVELRYLLLRSDASEAHLGLYFIGRVEHGDPAMAQQNAEELWVDLQSLLQLNARQLGVAAVGCEEDLRAILHPFTTTALAELRREGVTLPTEEPGVSIGFGPKPESITPPQTVIVPRPLPEKHSLLKVFCETLAQNHSPLLVSIRLDCDQANLPIMKKIVIPEELQATPEHSRVLRERIADLYGGTTAACSLRIYVASPERLSSALLNVLGNELLSTETSLWRAHRIATEHLSQAVHEFEIKPVSLDDAETMTTVYTVGEASQAFRLPIVLSDGYLGLPTSKPQYAFIPRHLPTTGALLGIKHTPEGDIPIRIPDEDRTKHIYILGQTGTGKSTLLTSMVLSDIDAGKGVCVLDPHGDLIEFLLPRIPKERADDLIHLDPGANVDRPFGLNILEASTDQEKDFFSNEFISFLKREFDPNLQGIVGPQFEQAVRAATYTVMDYQDGGTVAEISRLFESPAFLRDRLKSLKNPVARFYWDDIWQRKADFHKSEILGYITSKFDRFRTNSLMRNIIGQVKSSINFRAAMDTGSILLVNLSKGILGDLNSNFLGTIFLSRLYASAMSRQELPIDQRRPFYLYIDEFHNFAIDAMESMLSEIRKYGVGLVLAHQNQAQLPEKLREAVLGNVNSTIFFRPGAPDANRVHLYLQNRFTEAELLTFPNWHAIARILVDNAPTMPFVFSTVRDERKPNQELANAYRELCRLKYGKPRELVEQEIAERLAVDRTNQPSLTV